MFTKKEVDSIDTTYFRVQSSGPFQVTLESRNTHHEWHILSTETLIDGRAIKSCIIRHRHDRRTAFHPHGHAPNLLAAQELIKSHDEFQMNGRKNTDNQ